MVVVEFGNDFEMWIEGWVVLIFEGVVVLYVVGDVVEFEFVVVSGILLIEVCVDL